MPSWRITVLGYVVLAMAAAGLFAGDAHFSNVFNLGALLTFIASIAHGDEAS